MKSKVTVFIEGKAPVKVDVTKETTVEDIIKKLKIDKKKINCVHVSKDKLRPVCPISYDHKFLKNKYKPWEALYHRGVTEISDDRVLWVGFNPKKGEKKYGFNWVGNEKIKITETEAHKQFDKGARYHDRGYYSIQGIEANDTGKLFDIWVKVRNFELTKG